MVKTNRRAAARGVRHTAHGTAPRRRQRGVAAIEFAIVFLLFFILVWGILTFGFVFAAQQTLTLAAENGARAALHYQAGAQDVGSATALRSAAAQQATAKSLAWLQKFNPLYYPQAAVTVQGGTCAYDAALTCFTVSVSYPYAQHPLIPSMPALGLLVPQTLHGYAAMQMDPDNLLVKAT